MFTQIIEITGTEPVSLSDAKGWLRVHHTNEDNIINTRLIPAVRDFMEKRLDISLVEKTVNVVVERAEANFRLPLWPIIEVVEITPNTLIMEDGRLDNAEGENINVTYKSGKYISHSVHIAMLNLLAHWYVTRDMSSIPESVEKVIKTNTRILWFA
jgi:hypothetical protein